MKYKIWFENLKNIQKIQMYLIPILIYGVYYLNTMNNNIANTKLNIVSQNIKNEKQTKILKYYEKVLKDNKIKNINISFLEDKIKLNISAKFKNILKFINRVEKNYKILSYAMYKKDKLIFLDIQFSTKIYSIKDETSNRKLEKSPFSLQRNKKINTSKAIIGDFVLINSKWYTLNDKYKTYTITKIYQNNIILSNDTETISMDVFNVK